MSNMIIVLQSADIWLLLSIDAQEGVYSSVYDGITDTADCINHTRPTEDEIEDGFTRLLQVGYIEARNQDVTLTEKGRQVVLEARQSSPYCLRQWDFLKEKLSKGFPKMNEIEYKLEKRVWPRNSKMLK